jgi:penicillin-binding protein 1A
LVSFFFRAGLSAAVLVGLGISGYLVVIAQDLPDLSGLEPAPRSGQIVLLDRNGRVIARRGDVSAQAILADDLPVNLADAVLAVEDRRFYSHFGIDLIGTTRALVTNVREGRVVQGGSTITQQLAKNLFLTPERTYERKAQEMLLALWLEREFSKDEILALYLNRVYFGAGAWGAEAASRRYFGKDAHELNIGEAALLAGLLKAPSRYAPTTDSRRAAVRATVVLDLMHATGRITTQERREAAEIPIRVSRAASSTGAGWFADWAIPQIRTLSGGYEGDLVVRTTLDVNAQRAAEAALSLGLSTPELARGAEQGALISINATGGIVAMAGGLDYQSSPFNRAVSARRQPGSSFKPFVYLAALEMGISPDDIFQDEPIQVGDWSPQNYGDRYVGPVTLAEAFARSSNSVAVQLAEQTGRGWVVRTARRMGIESPLQSTHSLALGAYEVTPLELARAYLPFMNGGRSAEVHAVTSIVTHEGEVLFEYMPDIGDKIVADQVLAQMDGLFAGSVEYGTSRAAAVPNRIVRGKTGTTNDHRDAWFAGWEGGLAAVVWTGNDDFSATAQAVGGAGPARIFASYIEAAPAYPAGLDAVLALSASAPDPIAALLNGDLEGDAAPVLHANPLAVDPTPLPERDADASSDIEGDPIASLIGALNDEP